MTKLYQTNNNELCILIKQQNKWSYTPTFLNFPPPIKVYHHLNYGEIGES